MHVLVAMKKEGEKETFEGNSDLDQREVKKDKSFYKFTFAQDSSIN